MNVNFRKMSRFLPSAIHKRVSPLDFSSAIDFSSRGSGAWISFSLEFKNMLELQVGLGRDFVRKTRYMIGLIYF
jgi:hypothetical protein